MQVQGCAMKGFLFFALAFISTAIAQQKPVWVLPEVNAPRVQRVVFDSKSAGEPVSFHVLAPESYATDKQRRFPVIYWLHGTGGGLGGVVPLAAHFDRAMKAGKLPPCLVIFANGLMESLWCDSKDGRQPVETIVVRELVPHVDAHFRTVARREGRLIEGFSSGGYGAGRYAMRYPEVFGAVSMLGAGPLDQDFRGPRTRANPEERERIWQTVFGGDPDYYRAQSPLNLAAEAAPALDRRTFFRIAVGDRDGMLPGNQELSRRLAEKEIEHDFLVGRGARHQTLELFQALGEANWTFYQHAFAPARLEGAPARLPPLAETRLQWTAPEVAAPRVQRRLFASSAAGTQVSCFIYTPEIYDREPERRFPVLYWLHGGGGSQGRASVSHVAPMARRFDAAIQSGKIPPFLVVFPNGMHSLWMDSKDGRIPMETVLVRELLPYVDAHFRTQAAREGRLIEGFSMGGYGAARLGFKYPDLFAHVSILAGGPLQPEFVSAPRVNERMRLQVLGEIFGGDLAFFRAQSPWQLAEENAARLRQGSALRVVIGDSDEMLSVTREFQEHLQRLQIPHNYRELPGIPHNPSQMFDALGEDGWAFYRQIFDGKGDGR
jgi:enterochelin esterase-like enzyme